MKQLVSILSYPPFPNSKGPPMFRLYSLEGRCLLNSPQPEVKNDDDNTAVTCPCGAVCYWMCITSASLHNQRQLSRLLFICFPNDCFM